MTKQKILILLAIILTLAVSTKAFAAFTLSSNAITGTTASTIDLGAGNALSLQTTNNGNITTGNGTLTIGSVSTGGQAITIIKGGVLSGASATDNFLNVTGTLPAVMTAAEIGVYFNITSAGSSSTAQQRALTAGLGAGYTGTSPTYGAFFNNAAAGTGTNAYVTGNAANYGSVSTVSATTSGNNLASKGIASGSSSLNLGVLGVAIVSTNTPALNVGISGIALSATTNVGGFFGLIGTAPTLGTSSALIADNGATGSDIFEARNNGTPVFSVTNGGNVNIGSNLTFSPTAPTVASGFGTSPSFATGSTSTAFDLNVGTGSPGTTGVITLPAAAHGWICRATDMTTPVDITSETAYGTTSVTFTSTIAWSANDHLIATCAGF